MQSAIACCYHPDEVDRDDVPVCEVNLKLSRVEIEASDWTLKKLPFVQAVHNAQQLRCGPRAYHLLEDSMIRLQEYVGTDDEAIDELTKADLLPHDTDHPYRLYSVSAAGRDAIGESFREGVDFGHGRRDLDKSSERVYGDQLAVEYLERE